MDYINNCINKIKNLLKISSRYIINTCYSQDYKKKKRMYNKLIKMHNRELNQKIKTHKRVIKRLDKLLKKEGIK